MPGVGQSIEYPPYTMNYYLRVINQDDSVTVKTRTITVSQPVGAPVINQFYCRSACHHVRAVCEYHVAGQRSGQHGEFDHQWCDRLAECAVQRQLSTLPDCRRPIDLSVDGSGTGRLNAAAGNRECQFSAAAATHGDACAGGTRASDQWLYHLAEYDLAGWLCHSLVDDGRRHFERGLAARQCDDLGQCAVEFERARLPAVPSDAALPISIVYMLQAYNSAGQSVSQSLSLVVQPLSATPY